MKLRPDQYYCDNDFFAFIIHVGYEYTNYLGFNVNGDDIWWKNTYPTSRLAREFKGLRKVYPTFVGFKE